MHDTCSPIDSPPDGPQERSWEDTRTMLEHAHGGIFGPLSGQLNSAKLGRIWVNFGPNLADAGQTLPQLARLGPQHLSKFGPAWSNFAAGARETLPKCTHEFHSGIARVYTQLFCCRPSTGESIGEHLSCICSRRPPLAGGAFVQQSLYTFQRVEI